MSSQKTRLALTGTTVLIAILIGWHRKKVRVAKGAGAQEERERKSKEVA